VRQNGAIVSVTIDATDGRRVKFNNNAFGNLAPVRQLLLNPS
jgi:hypothetical protein